MKKMNFFLMMSSVFILMHTVVTEADGESQEVVKSNGHVKFKPGDGGGNHRPTPPGGNEKPEVIVPNPGGNVPETSGPLMINIAPNFDFGNHEIKVEALSLGNESVVKSTEDNVNYTSYVQVTDTRGGQKGWTLNLDTTALKSEKEVLEGTYIKINEKHVVAKSKGLEDYAPTAVAQKIEFNKKNQVIMIAEAQKGGGTWSMVFGKDDIQTNKINRGITLEIPITDAVKLNDADYTSTLTWNLTGNPTFSNSATPAD